MFKHHFSGKSFYFLIAAVTSIDKRHHGNNVVLFIEIQFQKIENIILFLIKIDILFVIVRKITEEGITLRYQLYR